MRANLKLKRRKAIDEPIAFLLSFYLRDYSVSNGIYPLRCPAPFIPKGLDLSRIQIRYSPFA